MPRSTPIQPTGSNRSRSRISQVVCRNHIPLSHTRSDSPRRCSRTVASRPGRPVNATPLSRPAVVQIDTVRSSCCHDRHRSSNGWAASGWKRIGFDCFGPAFPSQAPGADIRAQHGVGVGGLAQHVQRRLGGQATRLQVPVTGLLQHRARRLAGAECDLRHPVCRLVARHQSRLQHHCLGGCRPQLHPHHQLHNLGTGLSFEMKPPPGQRNPAHRSATPAGAGPWPRLLLPKRERLGSLRQ